MNTAPLNYWKEFVEDLSEVVLYPSAALQELNIPEDCQIFLSQKGLPESAAPFLDFKAPPIGKFQSVSELWNLGDDYRSFAVIGSNGSGDSIAISPDGAVVYFNHDNGFEKVLMNTSVSKLGESLKNYDELIAKTQAENGEDAYLDNDIPKHLQEWIETSLNDIDPPALKESCFWRQEIENLKSGKYE
jgi:hypothetical protein